MHIYCLAHVINFIVQSFLHAIDEAEDPEINDYFDKEAPIYFDINKDSDQAALEAKALKTPENSSAPVNEDKAVGDNESVLLEDVSGQSPLQHVSNHAICQFTLSPHINCFSSVLSPQKLSQHLSVAFVSVMLARRSMTTKRLMKNT